MPAEVIAAALLAQGPLTKLIEVVAKGVGVWFEPRRLRRLAQAEADVQLIQVRTARKAATLANRATVRVRKREAQRQRNLEAIVGQAARQLPAAVDAEPVDSDWMAEWVNSAQDVSDEQMQSLWGRILAGEVAAGGSFSRRALAAVRLLSKEEANTFTRFCSFVWWIDGLACSVQDPNAEAMLDTARVSYGSREVLRSIGLVTSAVTEFYNLKRDREYTLEYFDTEIRGRLGPGSGHLLVIALTPVGGELARIAGGVRSDEYFKLCLDHFRNNGLEVGPAPQLEGARLTRD